MADEERRSSKRSRFDQTEPEPKRSSRFDRRSRSPSRRESEVRRSRSPLTPGTALSPGAAEGSGPKAFAADPAAAAGKASSPPAGKSGSSTSNINGDMYIADGDYIKDIEINDLRNKYTLTKGSTQKTIKEETGAGTQSLIHYRLLEK
ncbi:MAG: hypothetical protein Q9183_002557 [Haloplaca sp. 2 TL-2023]